MRTHVVARARAHEFDHTPQSYDQLRRRAAAYARDYLAGRTVGNRTTQLGITLTPTGLAGATRNGTPAELLQAIPDLPSLLAAARYVDTQRFLKRDGGKRRRSRLDGIIRRVARAACAKFLLIDAADLFLCAPAGTNDAS